MRCNYHNVQQCSRRSAPLFPPKDASITVPNDEPHYIITHLDPISVPTYHLYHPSDSINSYANSPTPWYTATSLDSLCSSTSVQITSGLLTPTSLNATRLGGKLTGPGYLGSLLERDSTQPLYISNFNNGQRHGYRCRKQTLGPPPENEASTSPRCPDQWSSFSPVLPFALHEHKETTFWLRFQTASSRPYDQWCQRQCQRNGGALKQSEERPTEARRCATKSQWERYRWAKGTEDGTCAICQNAATYIEEISEQAALTHNTFAPYALQIRPARW